MWRGTDQLQVTGHAKAKPSTDSDSLSLDQLFIELGKHAPAGFSAGLHIRYAAPLVYVRSYPDAWVKLYDENAYAMRDPTVFWGLGVKGCTRWSGIRLPDPFNIMGQARKNGLVYGVVASCGPITSRSIIGVARADREFSDDEMEKVASLAQAMHDAACPPTELTPAQVEALRLLADGDRHTAAAAKLGISESAFKARLQSARVRLGARTTAQALKRAREYGLI